MGVCAKEGDLKTVWCPFTFGLPLKPFQTAYAQNTHHHTHTDIDIKIRVRAPLRPMIVSISCPFGPRPFEATTRPSRPRARRTRTCWQTRRKNEPVRAQKHAGGSYMALFIRGTLFRLAQSKPDGNPPFWGCPYFFTNSLATSARPVAPS